MKKRFLGKSGLEVSAVGLGCMSMSPDYYGAADEAESIRTLHYALDIGVNFWDTANVYGGGHNELLLANVLRERRDEVVLATKFGFVRNEQGLVGVNGKPDYLKQQCDESLKRLGVDHIDLYYMHRLDTSVPIEETVGAMAELVQAGKVRHLGLSEVSGDTLRRAYAVHPIAAVQSEYSLWSRDIEDEVFPACRELGVGIVPYSPLGRGFLTGQIKSPDDFAPDDFRKGLPRFQGENFQTNLDLVRELEDMARERGVKASQLALAWVLAQGDDIVPIPGTTKRANLKDNADSADLELSADDLRRINAIAEKTAGMRYGEYAMKFTNL
ncbi:aldo/keto reductase [Tumebacillus sp. ITR2]|uniref:Aldo/keto reductase n=1 Tax=Tumebacillus amylolyticus TaxID=2801339 RepID=A0ABS1J9F9_9BACL|nr:aldo/keto reductase [Tumebacillus amylolyticus]MBL0386850.1 aldo/keto reductase [Tumebacillus amylolyticus]